MPRILISYRRTDSASATGRLYDDLVDHFGPDQVFMDIDTIPPGADFIQAIRDAVSSSDVLLAVIGERWSSPAGRRRLNDPNDFVRTEIATALDRDIRVIPVLVDNTPVPRAEALPEPLARLARRQAFVVSNTRWRADVARLIEALERPSATIGPSRHRQADQVASTQDLQGRAVSPTPTTQQTASSAATSAGHWRILAGDFTSSDLLSSPVGIAVDRHGGIYVADSGHSRVLKLSPDGTALAWWGSEGKGPGQFRGIAGVTIDLEGYIYVADYGGNQIQKLSSDGEPLAQWGTKGDGPGKFNGPADVAVDVQGNLYVVEEWNHRVQKLSAQGQLLAQWGTKGNGSAQFNRPPGIAVDERRNVYVADWGNHRVQKLSPEGQPLAQWGTLGDGPVQSVGPFGVAVDIHGNVYVADREANRIQKLSPDGELLAQWGTEGWAPGQFKMPNSVAVDRQGNVYVADTENNRIQKLSAADEPGLANRGS